MNIIRLMPILPVFWLLNSCNQGDVPHIDESMQPAGKLFVMGGGSQSRELVARMLQESGVDRTGYVLLLPQLSGNPDTGACYLAGQLADLGVDSVFTLDWENIRLRPDSSARLVRDAGMIYIPGGDQDRYMRLLEGTPLKESLRQAYISGATIAGSGAGAAIMSNRMISGKEKKYPGIPGPSRTIEANNIEIKEGLGIIEGIIIDQHLVRRHRINRLISVSLENPDCICVGIDESTALFIDSGVAEVIGESQVIVLKHIRAETSVVNGQLGGKNLDLSIYLPGDTLKI
jgi:cyanophycinase